MADNNQSGWYFFLNNSKVTFIIVTLVVILGFISIIQMPKESSPEIDFPYATVTTVMPGASAEEVEELVTNPIEDKIGGLEKLDEFTSVSRPGISVVSVLFDINEDGDEMVAKLRDRLSGISRELPSDAEEPVVTKISLTDTPLLVFSMSGPYLPSELSTYAEGLEDDIESVAYVSRVDIVGAPEEEIIVKIRQEALAQYNLKVGQVVSAIRSANTTLPVGSIQTDDSVFTINLAGKIENIEELSNLPIASPAGVPIFLRDIASVETIYNNKGQISRLSSEGDEARPAVSLYVYKTNGGNILEVVAQAKEAIGRQEAEVLPEDVLIVEIENMAEYIKTDLFNLLYGGLATMVIVFVLLLLFVGKREAVLASFGIPLTFLIAFIFLNGLGYTINFLTLFSLILALGILVDSSIVVTEGIYQNLKLGYDLKDSAKRTIDEFSTPLISGTLTTVFVFLPMLFMSGIMGKFIESIPVTVSIVLFASLFVALGVIPAFAVRFLKNSKDDSGEIVSKSISPTAKYYDKWSGKYSETLHKLLVSRKNQNKFFVSLAILFVVAIALPVVGLVSVNMFPSEELETFYIDIDNPVGTTLSKTDDDAKVIEEVLRSDERINTTLARVGRGEANLNQASFILTVSDDSDEGSIELVDEYNKIFADLLPQSEVKVYQAQSGPTSEAPVQVTLVGQSLVSVDEASALYMSLLREIPGTQNVRTNSPDSNGEFTFTVDRNKAGSLGVDPLAVASILRTAITGSEATVLKSAGDDTDVRVVFDLGGGEEDRNVVGVPATSLSVIEGIKIETQAGLSVPLSSLVNVTLSPNRATINHSDGDRIVKVMSDLEDGFTAGAVTAEFNKKREGVSLLDGVEVRFGGEAEDIAESFADLGRAMVIGIFMIFALLVWQFNSYRQPFFILLSIPLALIGVFFGLLVVRQPLSFPGFIGVVALAGIVVNNAIILIDRINLNRAQGLAKKEAVEEGAKSRLQPIFLTTITTVFGILPLALSSPVWGPLGYSIVFGLSFSTVSTLFLIPVLYERFEK